MAKRKQSAADTIRQKLKPPNGELRSLIGRTSICIQQTRDALPSLLAQSQLTPVEQREVLDAFADDLSGFASVDEIRRLSSDAVTPTILLCRQRREWAESFKMTEQAGRATNATPAKAQTPQGQQGQQGQPKIIPITDPEIQAVFEAVQKADPETLNLIEICREVERTQGGAKAQSIRKKWNRWKDKHG